MNINNIMQQGQPYRSFSTDEKDYKKSREPYPYTLNIMFN